MLFNDSELVDLVLNVVLPTARAPGLSPHSCGFYRRMGGHRDAGPALPCPSFKPLGGS